MALAGGLAVALASAILAAQMPPGAGAGPAVGVTDTTILIGVEGPTGSFPVDEENLGMQLVIRDVNERGGVNGRRLVAIGFPRASDAPAQETTNARRLMEESGVLLLFGHGGPASPDIAPIAMARHVPYMFPHTALVTLDGARYVFTSYPRYLGESQVMFRYLARTRGFRRLAIAYADNAYGRFFLDRLNEYASRFGYLVAGAQPVADRNPADLTAAVGALRRTAPDAVILALYPEQARRVMEARKSLGWTAAPIVSSGPLTDEQYLNVEGGAADGALGFCYYPDPNESDKPGIVQYRQLMSRYYPEHPLNRYSLYGYVFGRLIVEGLARAGRDVTRERFVDAMETIAGWDSGGILPPVSFSKTNHHAQRAGFLCELKEGRFRPLTDWIEPE